MQWIICVWLWQNVKFYHIHTALPFCSWQNTFSYLINVRERPPTRKTRDSLFLSLCLNLVLEMFSVSHLWGFLGISQHVCFQDHSPRAEDNMAWKEDRNTISVFLQVQGEWNNSLVLNIHIDYRAIELTAYLGVQLNIYLYIVIGLYISNFQSLSFASASQLWGQGDVHSGRLEAL